MHAFHARSTIAAIFTLFSLAGQATAQSLTIDPDGLGHTNVNVDNNPLTSLNQIAPGVEIRLGSNPPGSLLINGPWTAGSFDLGVRFSSTLRLEGGVHLQDILLSSPGTGGGTSTVPGRIDLDNSTLSAVWVWPFGGDINGLEYGLENNSHLSIDFNWQFNLGYGSAPFEVGLTEQTIVNTRQRDLRETRIATGSTISITGTTHITRASGEQVAAKGHNIIIDGGTFETNRVTTETLGDPALAEGGIDFRSGTLRVRDHHGVQYEFPNSIAVIAYRAINQDVMNAILAGVSPGPVNTTPVLVAGQTLEFTSWYNPYLGIDWDEPNDFEIRGGNWDTTFISSTLEIRGGRLLLGPEGGWENPQGDWPQGPRVPEFHMLNQGYVWDADFDLNSETWGTNTYTGPNPAGPFILDGGQFDFSYVEFKDGDLRPGADPNSYFPQFRAGAMRGRSLRLEYPDGPDGTPLTAEILFGSAGEVLTCEIGYFWANRSLRIPDGATVSTLSTRMAIPDLSVGDGATVALSNVGFNYRFAVNIITPQVGLNSRLQIGRLQIGTVPGGLGQEVGFEIGAGSLVEVGGYEGSLSGLASLSTGPGTLRLMAGALGGLATIRRDFTVEGHFELDPAGTLGFNLVTPTDATSYTIGGDLQINGCGLSLTLADELFTPGEQVLMNIGGTTTGTFAGFPEGTLVESRLGVDLYLSYTGGDGNDIVLTTAGPCPADTNGDGILDNGDIITFVSLFLAGNIAADINGDGILDNGDIIGFVQLFLTGC